MDLPAAVLGLVLFELAVGGLAIGWAAPTWGRVRPGFYSLLTVTLGLSALGAWAAMQGPLSQLAADGLGAATWASRGLAVTAGVALVSGLLVVARAAPVGRLAGIASVVTGLMTFLPLAEVRASGTPSGDLGVGLVELVLGAFFLGAVWDGLLLGHWYLVERRLSNQPMVWMAWVNVAAVAAGLAAVLLSALDPAPCAGLSGADLVRCSITYSPLLSVGGVTIVMGAGLVVIVGLLAAFNVRLAREGGRSIQAATGMFYLAVIFAPAAEFAAKIRFF